MPPPWTNTAAASQLDLTTGKLRNLWAASLTCLSWARFKMVQGSGGDEAGSPFCCASQDAPLLNLHSTTNKEAFSFRPGCGHPGTAQPRSTFPGPKPIKRAEKRGQDTCPGDPKEEDSGLFLCKETKKGSHLKIVSLKDLGTKSFFLHLSSELLPSCVSVLILSNLPCCCV